MSIFVGAAMGGRLASIDALSLVFQAGWVVQLVLFVLLALSVVSWTIIVYKWRELRRAGQDSEAFLEVYQDGSLDTAYSRARELNRSPLAGIYASAYAEFSKMTKFVGKGGVEERHLQALARHIGWAGSREGLRLERGLNFLATTGSAAPFIGLFGTVIGIINAFHDIGRAGTASLAVVAPGIAEALIATAMGLFAAIPATVFYNYFVGELRGLTAAIDLFIADCEGDLRRHAAGPRETSPSARG
jgi:biopolymer transport protein TolQ